MLHHLNARSSFLALLSIATFVLNGCVRITSFSAKCDIYAENEAEVGFTIQGNEPLSYVKVTVNPPQEMPFSETYRPSGTVVSDQFLVRARAGQEATVSVNVENYEGETQSASKTVACR